MPEPTSTPEPPGRPAWQPVTFGGVAALAQASRGRLGLAALVLALLIALALTRAATQTWIPAVEVAVATLPDTGEIRDGQLLWPPSGPRILADTPFLAIHVQAEAGASVGQSADLEIELRTNVVRVSSLLGYFDLPYPPNRWFPLQRAAIEPVAGAWAPHLPIGLFLALSLLIVAYWWLLATLSWLPLRVYCSLLDRPVSASCCWRLAFAAVMPGTLLLAPLALLYAAHRLGLAEFLLLGATHVFVHAAYLLIAPFFLTHETAASPFAPPKPDAFPTPPPSADNPFAAASPLTDPTETDEPTSPFQAPCTPGPDPSSPRPSPPASPAPTDSPLNPS